MSDLTDPDVAQAVRELAVTLHSHEIGPESRSDVLELLEQARSLIASHQPRLRWYEVDEPGARRPRTRNRELSAWSGSLNPIAPPLALDDATGADGAAWVRGHVRVDRLREGPPRSVHGGVMAGLFDEILGAAQRLGRGPGGVTARLTVRYRRPTPIDEDLTFEGWIHDERSRRLTARARCLVGGEVTAEAEAVFLRVDFAGMEESMRSRPAGGASRAAPPLS